MGNIFNKDFLEFIDCLNQYKVRHLLVGGYSVILHGYPRTTGDLDIWVACDLENYRKIEKAFRGFGLPVFDMTAENFLNTEKFDVFRFGRPPLAIDIITDLKGSNFEKSYMRSEKQIFDSVEINFISYKDLIHAKKAAGRPRDMNDIENLESN